MFNKLLYKLAPFLPLNLFWELFSPSFLKDPWQHRILPEHWWLLNIITTKKPANILEVGCGFGRNLLFLTHQGVKPRRLTGVDFSSRLLHQAKVNLPKVKLHRASVLKLPFTTNKFDLVFTHGLLMHVSPATVSLALKELIRVSRRWLVIIEETRIRPNRINFFTWAHDYPRLINQFSLRIIDSRHDQHHQTWYLLKKP